MVEGVLNPIVNQVQEKNQINVQHMEVVRDVMNRIVIQVQLANQINVSHMEAENVVRIVLIGLIQDVEL